VTGAIWLALGLSGAAQRVANLLGRPVIVGVVVGLGVAFMLEGAKMIASGWILGLATLAGALVLLRQRKVPAMLVVLLFGAVVALVQRPELLGQMSVLQPVLAFPGSRPPRSRCRISRWVRCSLRCPRSRSRSETRSSR
jgi:hypothetical protein